MLISASRAIFAAVVMVETADESTWTRGIQSKIDGAFGRPGVHA